MVDSLDTMLVMGLHREFYEAIPVLANMTFALDEVRGAFAWAGLGWFGVLTVSLGSLPIRANTRRSSRQSFVTSAASSPHTLCRESPSSSRGRTTWARCCCPLSTRHTVSRCMRSIPCRMSIPSLPHILCVCLIDYLRRRGETRPGWTGSDILWAEALSCQVEYKYLAHLTGRKEYFDAVSDHTHSASLLSRLKERPRDRSSA